MPERWLRSWALVVNGPNYTPLPVAQPAITARYAIDYETIGRMKGNIWPAVDELVTRVNDPSWSRSRACWGCHNWTAVDGLAHLPFRPGAGSGAVQTCSSCHYAKLDEVAIDADLAIDTLDAMKAFREGWRAILSPKKPKLRLARTLCYHQGFTGKRTDRPDEQPAFTYRGKPNDVNERTDCPWCGQKDGARVERYTRIKPKEDPVRFVAIACMVGTCGRHIAQPEVEPWPVYPKPDSTVTLYPKPEPPK